MMFNMKLQDLLFLLDWRGIISNLLADFTGNMWNMNLFWRCLNPGWSKRVPQFQSHETKGWTATYYASLSRIVASENQTPPKGNSFKTCHEGLLSLLEGIHMLQPRSNQILNEEHAWTCKLLVNLIILKCGNVNLLRGSTFHMTSTKHTSAFQQFLENCQWWLF